MEHDFLFAKNDISSLSKLIGLFLSESTLYVRVTSFSLYETWIFLFANNDLSSLSKIIGQFL